MALRSALKSIVVIFFIFSWFCLSATASPVSTYGGEIYSQISNDPNSPVLSFGDEFDLPIPADQNDSKGWMVDATIEVDEHLTIDDIDIGIGLTHDSLSDLQIIIVSPDGTEVCLTSNDPSSVSAEGDEILDIVFDDEAETFPDSAVPQDPLSAFDGEDAFGTWHVRIYDAHYADTGTLDSVEIMITIPEPATAIIFIFGIAFTTLIKSRR